MTTQVTTKELMTQMIDGYNQRNLPKLMSLFTKDINMWGTGVDEHRVGLDEVEAQMKRDWSQAEKSRMEIVSLIPSTDADNWIAATCRAIITIDGTDHVFDDLRSTIIIKQENGTWKISHAHASFPDFRNPDNNSFPVNNG